MLPGLRIIRAMPLALLLGLGACNGADEGALAVAIIGTEQSVFASGVHLSEAAQQVQAATGAGLVALDADGEVIPALAERWIVTDDGLSFIFRLRDAAGADGTPLTAASVAQALRQRIAALRNTSLGLDLAPIAQVRAMAGRVVEVRLAAPLPDLLTLLAQPELVLAPGGQATGPMVLEREGARARLRMRPLPDPVVAPGEPPEHLRELVLVAAPAREAVAMFDAGEVELVLGGRLAHLPLVDTGPLARGTLRLDPALGLFGLLVRHQRGPLADPELREALSMALDRPALLQRYNLAGWQATSRLVPPGLPGDTGFFTERWSDLSLEQRRAEAARRIGRWLAAAGPSSGSGRTPARMLELRLALEEGEGLDLLLADLAAQWGPVGVRLVRASQPAEADLVLIDRIARYANPIWFLNQFHCSLQRGACLEDADYLVAQARAALDPAERSALLTEAEAVLTGANLFIPIGAPLRFSLVRGSVRGLVPNAMAFHPLPPMARPAR